MLVRLCWYLDPLSAHQLRKNFVKVGPSLTKLSGSAHDSTPDCDTYMYRIGEQGMDVDESSASSPTSRASMARTGYCWVYEKIVIAKGSSSHPEWSMHKMTCRDHDDCSSHPR